MSAKALLSSIKVGDFTLPNRMIMAPLTRCRADMPGHIPSDMMAEYYSQRASAGLLIAEATTIAGNASAFATEPGIFDQKCIDGWKKTTEAVHKKNGKIFLQIWHGGRATHSVNQDGEQPISAFAVAAGHSIGPEFNLKREKLDYEVPRALKDDELPAIVEMFVQGAKNAIEAGFDGVEVHAANGYLLDQFQRAPADAREGPYGGSIENRCKLTFEVLEAVSKAIGAGKVGVRISPLNSYNTLKHEDPIAFTKYFAAKSQELDIAYLHLMRGDFFQAQTGDVVTPARESFKNTLILNMGYGVEDGEEAIQNKTADAICYGTKFLANPDFVERVEKGAELNEMDPTTFYTVEAKGYTDYPFMKQ